MENKNCSSCSSCLGCSDCLYCSYCYYSSGLRISEYMIFCRGDGKWGRQGAGYQKNLMAWDKPVTKKRYEAILEEIRTILVDFKLDARKKWKKEWGRVSAFQWSKIAKIPEFDLEITKKITRLATIEVDEEKTIDIEGKKFTVSELKALIASTARMLADFSFRPFCQ